ncbi:hypothetical protein C8J56DRAFT_919347 [Mycena floridula]|nr:hypothetical protein C8J56DRAFT_919347 [Mycena floridula]
MSSSAFRTPSSATSSKLSNQPVSIVVTAPPWAKDEPPSPTEPVSLSDNYLATESRHSDIGSYHSNYTAQSPSRWWTFTLPRPKEPHSDSDLDSRPNTERRPFKDRSLSQWLPSTNVLREGSSFTRKEKGPESTVTERSRFRDWNLSIALPTPPSAQAPFTLAHNATPGWDTPWTARLPPSGPSGGSRRQSSYGMQREPDQDSDHSSKHVPKWKKRKKRLRAFILTNAYVPLLFRFINITFTTAALVVAIQIRIWEKRHLAMGALGSSPTLIVIFAPLTLLHVMAAIYLEYFGRPLGLWRTSAKLAHTLSEVLFICAWSAALSLCFDNYFTSLVPCAPPSSISWYNELKRPTTNLPTFEDSIGDRLCESQLALICLVGVGLLVYCINLVISLFRIFEKVKYHPAALRSSP